VLFATTVDYYLKSDHFIRGCKVMMLDLQCEAKYSYKEQLLEGWWIGSNGGAAWEV
jgi:hypothetical protein